MVREVWSDKLRLLAYVRPGRWSRLRSARRFRLHCNILHSPGNGVGWEGRPAAIPLQDPN